MIEGVQFEQPWMLALLLLLPFYALFRRRQRRRRTVRFPPLQYRAGETGWRFWKQLAPQLEILVLVLVVAGLAGPYEETRLELIEDEGVDVMLVLDVSLSMLAEDLPPNRLEALRRIARDFVARAGGNRIGIVIFAKDSYVQTPLTTDHRSLLGLLDGVTVYTLDQNKSGGTSVGDALLVAVERLTRSRVEGRDQSLVLITDGESNTGIEPELAARYVREQGVRFYAIGVGGTEPVAVSFEGNPIGAEGDYLAVLDDRRLRKVTELAGGRYYRATDVGILEEIFAELSRLESAPLELRTVASRRSFGHWPALAAMTLFALHLALGGVFLEEPVPMIAFVRPHWLLLALPWIAFWIWFARRQRRSCEWVWEHVHERFRERFTLYRRETLARRLAALLVLGLLLVLAAAGPAVRGETEVRELASRVVLLLDGSASMLADDVSTGDGQETRFERGRKIAVELSERLAGSRFALVVFSGVAALQLPMTADPATIDEALVAASFHTFYRSSGSSFTAALDSVLHFVEPGRADLQAVLLSDGEQPFDEPFDEPLSALEEAGVPVHAVAIGSREGQPRLIFDFRDVVAKKEEKTVLREYTTRREDRHLKRIARSSGGRFTRAEGEAAQELAAAIEKRITGAETVRAEGWRDLSGVPLTLFLVGFLLEALLLGRRGKRPRSDFDIDRLGGGRPATAAGLTLLLTVGLTTLACRDNSPLGRASRENERGIAADALESWPQARVHYDRSRAFGVRPEIPAYNLARSVTLQEDWSEAHELYQRALELAPQLAVGHYNDGHVLYRWGEAELDLENCELERALELWNAARRRFAGAAALYAEESAGRSQARTNLRFVAQRITEVEEAGAPPPPAAGGGGGEGESGGEGEDEGESGGEGEDEGESGGEGEDEGESGGEGEDEGESGGEGEDEGESGGEGEDEGESGGEGEDEGESGGEGEDEGESGGEGEDEGESGGEGEDEGESGGDGEGDGEGDGGAGPAPLTGEELEQIREALARISEGRFADGRYHYRSLPEQFPKEVWESPEAEIWW